VRRTGAHGKEARPANHLAHDKGRLSGSVCQLQSPATTTAKIPISKQKRHPIDRIGLALGSVFGMPDLSRSLLQLDLLNDGDIYMPSVQLLGRPYPGSQIHN
jgi:hypothetical protein